MPKKMTYTDAGVDYDAMDAFKRKAQAAAVSTDHFVERFGFSVVPWSRGESVFLVKTPFGYLALVIEGLGTKNLVADAMYKLAKKMKSLTGISYYDQVAHCNVAAIVNDIVTLGALPIMIGQYLAVGKSNWFADQRRYDDLIGGTLVACNKARCCWGPGETTTLNGIIGSGTTDLAGAALGWISSEERLINPQRIRSGDAIVFIGSSGLHANGYTMARKIADQLPYGYLTQLKDGRIFGEALLDPTHIYVGLVEDCLNRGVNIHYAVNITGHGWRKLMRAPQSFTYIIDKLPERRLPIFDFLQERGHIDDAEAYATFNMGAGFALYVPESDIERVQAVSRNLALKAWRAGYIKNSKSKKVIIKSKGIEYASSTLGVR